MGTLLSLDRPLWTGAGRLTPIAITGRVTPGDNDVVSVTAGEVLRAALRAPAGRAARRELGYCLAGLVPSLAGFAVVALLLTAGAGLTVTLLGTFPGLLVLVLTLRLARRLGGLHRRLAGWLLGEQFAAPPPFRPARGVLGRLDARLRDGTGWRAVAYVALKLPLSLLGIYAAAFWVSGLINLTSPLWWALFRNHPAGGRLGSVLVGTPLPGVAFRVATWPGTLAALVMGAATLLPRRGSPGPSRRATGG